MSFLKFAWSEHAVIESFADEPKVNNNSEEAKQAAAQFRKTANAAKEAMSNIKKSNDFLYVRTRAIGSLEKWGPNLNGDGFPMQELEASYQTFRGKGNFLDHKSDDLRMIRGLVIDAFLNKEDQCVECLIAVDKVSHPQLARHIETGVVNSVSMGTRVGYSNCSVCANTARTEDEYCNHIKSYKGMKFGALVNNAAHKFGQWPVHEVNHDLEFIELSWVSVPAFREANVLERIASLKETVVDSQQPSEAEVEMAKFAATFCKKELDPEAPAMTQSEFEKHMKEQQEANKPKPKAEAVASSVPANLARISEAAQCRGTECSTDPRRAKTEAANMNQIKTADGMQRIKITVDKISFRKSFNDFTSEGTVTINEKEYEWWAGSTDKSKWTVSLDKDAAELISSRGNSQINSAVEQLLAKNVNDTELIIANITANVLVKNSYLQGGEDPNMTKPIEEVVQDRLYKKDVEVYDKKDLEVPLGEPVRETEQRNYDRAAANGPAAPNGKLRAVDSNTSKEEEKRKQELRRAYLIYLKDKKNANKNR